MKSCQGLVGTKLRNKFMTTMTVVHGDIDVSIKGGVEDSN